MAASNASPTIVGRDALRFSVELPYLRDLFSVLSEGSSTLESSVLSELNNMLSNFLMTAIANNQVERIGIFYSFLLFFISILLLI